MQISDALANRVTSLKASAIREIFKMVGQKDIISFAGGIPDPNSFPTEALARISADILNTSGKAALVYGITEGYAPLIELVKEKNAAAQIGRGFDQTIITTGAQQAIDLTCKSLVNEGEGVIVEDPSFIGSLNSFRSYNAKLYGVPVESDGMDVDAVEKVLKTQNIKLIYTIPTFQNPTGITMSLEKRKRLIALAKQYDCYILEDNPYGELRFRGERVPAIKSMDDEGRVIYVGTFSKTISPGLRVGFVTGHKDIIDRVVVVKQVNDVHTTLLAQMMVEQYIKTCDFPGHVAECCEIYKKRCDQMLASIKTHFPQNVQYTRPDGGIFLWCTLPDGVDTGAIFERCIEKKVAFVPGRTCMVDIDAPSNCFRLNYSTMPEDKIDLGIQIVGSVLREFM